MIEGFVDGREARIVLTVSGSHDPTQQIEAVIDTGYTAWLSLPPDRISSLALSWQGIGRGMLADGNECLFDVYEAEVDWDGQPRRVLVDEADTDPLIGMALLGGYELRMEVCSGGKVWISQLSAHRS